MKYKKLQFWSQFFKEFDFWGIYMLGEICFHAYGPKKLNKKQLGTSKVIQIAHALSLSLSSFLGLGISKLTTGICWPFWTLKYHIIVKSKCTMLENQMNLDPWEALKVTDLVVFSTWQFFKTWFVMSVKHGKLYTLALL
jgi:hypothetical protein